MKKLVLILLVSLIGISCSVNDDGPEYYYEILPVESYELPTSFELGKVYMVTLYYKRPTNCHTSSLLYFEKYESTRTIAIQSLVVKLDDCVPLPNEEPRELKFQFEVRNSTPYVFKFYKGDDENGEPLFENVTVPVNLSVAN